jgi:hypothetical protein
MALRITEMGTTPRLRKRVGFRKFFLNNSALTLAMRAAAMAPEERAALRRRRGLL